MTAERPLVPDSSPKPGTEEFRRANEAVNREGWEDNAAVIIGTQETKEELARRREQLEQGRETVDLRTYIHRNAVPFVTSVEVSEIMKNDSLVSTQSRDIWNQMPANKFRLSGNDLLFKSSGGDIKHLIIRPFEIAELADFIEKNHKEMIYLKGPNYSASMKSLITYRENKKFFDDLLGHRIEELGFVPVSDVEDDIMSGIIHTACKDQMRPTYPF